MLFTSAHNASLLGANTAVSLMCLRNQPIALFSLSSQSQFVYRFRGPCESGAVPLPSPLLNRLFSMLSLPSSDTSVPEPRASASSLLPFPPAPFSLQRNIAADCWADGVFPALYLHNHISCVYLWVLTEAARPGFNHYGDRKMNSPLGFWLSSSQQRAISKKKPRKMTFSFFLSCLCQRSSLH